MPKRSDEIGEQHAHRALESRAGDRGRRRPSARGGSWRAPRACRRRPASSRRARAPVRSARYSVCPVNAMPASLIAPLCTGAVTIASNSAVAAAVGGDVERAQHVGAVGGIELAGDGGRASGTCRTSEPAARPRGAACRNRNRRSARRRGASAPGCAADRGRRRSRRAPAAARAPAPTHRSGPMPAGSPAVTAISGMLSFECLMLDGLRSAMSRASSPLI